MRVLTGINALLWGAFTWIGGDLLSRLTLRSIPGFPTHGQITYYLYFPIGMLALALAAFGLSKVKNIRYVGVGIEILVLVVLAPFTIPFILAYMPPAVYEVLYKIFN
jgi:hypothetical protein